MRSLSRMIGAMVVGAVLFSVVGAPAQDWPQWRGPNRDGRYDEMPILTDWPATGLKPLWRQPIGGGYASFVVAGGRAFTIEQRRRQEVVSPAGAVFSNSPSERNPSRKLGWSATSVPLLVRIATVHATGLPVSASSTRPLTVASSPAANAGNTRRNQIQRTSLSPLHW